MNDNHSQGDMTRKRVDRLLAQYGEYQAAPSEADRQRISDEMTYADPVVWMTYKREAYTGTDHEISTFADLKRHAVSHGGICAKRFSFLREFLHNAHGQDLLDAATFPDNMPLEDLYAGSLMRSVARDATFMEGWTGHEQYRKNGTVAKWEDYCGPDASFV